MCQALGYERLSQEDPHKDQDFERKLILFWCIYVLERTTSLRLGRAPAIHDDDIGSPMPQSGHENPAVASLLQFWVDCARVQGNISRQLYGPRARLLAADERVRLAEGFSDELDQIYKRKLEVRRISCPPSPKCWADQRQLDMDRGLKASSRYPTMTTTPQRNCCWRVRPC